MRQCLAFVLFRVKYLAVCRIASSVAFNQSCRSCRVNLNSSNCAIVASASRGLAAKASNPMSAAELHGRKSAQISVSSIVQLRPPKFASIVIRLDR